MAAVTVCAASRPSSLTTIVAPAAPPQESVRTAQQHDAVSSTHAPACGSRASPQPLRLLESSPGALRLCGFITVLSHAILGHKITRSP